MVKYAELYRNMQKYGTKSLYVNNLSIATAARLSESARPMLKLAEQFNKPAMGIAGQLSESFKGADAIFKENKALMGSSTAPLQSNL